jgi:hypothetical protein
MRSAPRLPQRTWSCNILSRLHRSLHARFRRPAFASYFGAPKGGTSPRRSRQDALRTVITFNREINNWPKLFGEAPCHTTTWLPDAPRNPLKLDGKRWGLKEAAAERVANRALTAQSSHGPAAVKQWQFDPATARGPWSFCPGLARARRLSGERHDWYICGVRCRRNRRPGWG